MSRRGSPALWIIAAALLGHAVQRRMYYQGNDALPSLAGGILVAWMGLLVPREPIGATWLAAGVAILWQYQQLMHDQPLVQAVVPERFFILVLPTLTLFFAACLLLPKTRRFLVPVFLAGYFAVGAWMMRRVPDPFIDVVVVTRDAAAALSQGHDPYAIDIPNIYAADPQHVKASDVYAAGYIAGDRVKLGYPYMPLSLAIAWAGQSIGGDFRLGSLAALVIAAGLLVATGSSLATAAAGLLLFTPRVFYVLEEGWSEPAVALCLALLAFCAVRKPAFLPIAAGLLLASKQYVLLAAPPLLLLLPRPWRLKPVAAFYAKAALVAAMVTLPLALWNPAAFWHSAVAVQFADPFRPDSLNFAAWWVNLGHARPPGWLDFLLAILALAIGLWKAPRTPAGFFAALAAVYLTFFAFAKQAFCNYYFFAIALLCCAVAAAGAETFHSSRDRA